MTDTFDRGALLAELDRDEAMRLKPYVDTVGKVTIAIGRNLTDKGLSTTECYLLCNNDIDESVAELDADFMWCGWWRTLDPVRQRALINLCFNLGDPGLDQFVHFCAALKAHNWQAAATALQQSKWWTQVGKRGPRVQHMILTGTVPAGEPAPLATT